MASHAGHYCDHCVASVRTSASLCPAIEALVVRVSVALQLGQSAHSDPVEFSSDPGTEQRIDGVRRSLLGWAEPARIPQAREKDHRAHRCFQAPLAKGRTEQQLVEHALA